MKVTTLLLITMLLIGIFIFIRIHVIALSRKKRKGLVEEALRSSLYLASRTEELDEGALFQAAIEDSVQLTGSAIGYFHLINEDQETIQLVTWSRETLAHCSVSEKDAHYPIANAGVWVDSLHERKPLIQNDYPSLQHRKGLPAGHVPISRLLSVPVMRAGNIVAILGVGNKKEDYTRFDINQVSLIADTAVTMFLQKRAEAALRVAKQAAEEANLAKSRFLAVMSHEIRTPLNAIVGITEILLRSALPDEQREYLESAKYASDHLLTVIDDILDFSKIESGKLQLARTDFNLHELLAYSIRTFELGAMKNSLSFRCAIAPGVPVSCAGDPDRLKQVLFNLLSNAVKFTDAGSVVLEAERCVDETRLGRGARPGELALQVTVRDTGIGIAREFHEAIFERFTQVDSADTRRYGGTGLGLSISKHIVREMGGDLRVESEPGQGSAFSFTAYIDVNAARQATGTADGTGNKAQRTSLRILLVEDNLLNSRIASALIGIMGHRVECAYNGMQAIELLRAGDFDLVFLDLEMPDMDGLETSRRIRAGEGGERGRTVPIIALTAHALADYRDRCLAAGMNDFITKPVDGAKLAEAIGKLFSAVIPVRTEDR